MIGEGLIPGADVTRQQRLVVDAPLVDRARALEVRLDLCHLSTRAVCQPLIRPVPLAALVGQRQAGASH